MQKIVKTVFAEQKQRLDDAIAVSEKNPEINSLEKGIEYMQILIDHVKNRLTSFEERVYALVETNDLLDIIESIECEKASYIATLALVGTETTKPFSKLCIDTEYHVITETADLLIKKLKGGIS